jgi:hypothetical protein
LSWRFGVGTVRLFRSKVYVYVLLQGYMPHRRLRCFGGLHLHAVAMDPACDAAQQRACRTERPCQSARGTARVHKAEIEKWWPIIKAAGIKAE